MVEISLRFLSKYNTTKVLSFSFPVKKTSIHVIFPKHYKYLYIFVIKKAAVN